mmetsp:Transcript_28616/g.50381  ORF Transcript_28616/g.50381 Transcript_28616/m.50381 type:complete len:118 (+) Transcript_28616:1-354(+)
MYVMYVYVRMLYVAPPDKKSREAIAEIRLKNISHEEEVTASGIAGLTEGFSGAEVCAVFQRAAAKAMEEDVHAGSLAMSHVLAAVSGVSSRITPEMLRWYQGFAKGAKGRGASVAST